MLAGGLRRAIQRTADGAQAGGGEDIVGMLQATEAGTMNEPGEDVGVWKKKKIRRCKPPEGRRGMD